MLEEIKLHIDIAEEAGLTSHLMDKDFNTVTGFTFGQNTSLVKSLNDFGRVGEKNQTQPVTTQTSSNKKQVLFM